MTNSATSVLTAMDTRPAAAASSTAAAAATAASRASIKNLPVSLFAAVMGLSGLSMGWRLAHTEFGAVVPRVVSDVIGLFATFVFVVLAIAYGAKLLRHPAAVKAEFNHPIAGNFFGTIAIALLLQSAVLGHYNSTLGQVMWIAGTVATLLLAAHVVSRLLGGNCHPAHAVPAWIIPGVAALDIPVTGSHMPMAWAGEVLLLSAAVGSVLALVLFTMIVTRLIQHEPLAPAMTPSLLILVAPFEVGFTAYVNLTGRVDLFAGLLFYFGVFLFVVLAPKVFKKSVPFGAGWWAISFPLAAMVNAGVVYAGTRGAWLLQALAGGLLVLLTAALLVLTVRTLRILLNRRLLTS
ncbi:tellurite resistance protein [Variovorax boronicumulans]|uniref:SLAC1 anion channel family protein n=1 Tax=Variovorax boronicumulans TaxID=436515 RepID=UPI002782073B|nr:SLAC1 anion channel family protein [Variovorax boronicumulans]MDQ0035437.1 tellurite resistance protein [Variovorax boronicumulans]